MQDLSLIVRGGEVAQWGLGYAISIILLPSICLVLPSSKSEYVGKIILRGMVGYSHIKCLL